MRGAVYMEKDGIYELIDIFLSVDEKGKDKIIDLARCLLRQQGESCAVHHQDCDILR